MISGRIVPILFRAIAHLPLPLAQGLGAALGGLLSLFPNETRRVARRNIYRCFPDWSPAQRRRLLRQSLRQTGRTAAETAAIWLWPLPRVLPQVRAVEGEELLQQGMARGRGVIMLSPHLGSWEMAGLYLSVQWGITSMYRPPKLMAMNALMQQGRERGGAHLVPTDASGVRALLRTLRQGGMIGILPDQDPERESGVFAPFFGHPANTMVLLPKLARKSGATVLFIYAERLPQGRGFRLHIRSAPAGIDDADLGRAAASLNQGVEACVRQLPVQYQWGYKRFKGQPEGEPDFYARDVKDD
ncbi:MAG TPA: hypothetical protein ENI94_00075 [Gammaproteobacteria bacterium]|nr:hypothetical protein [Gammaproteobacteria bacterium]